GGLVTGAVGTGRGRGLGGLLRAHGLECRRWHRPRPPSSARPVAEELWTPHALSLPVLAPITKVPVRACCSRGPGTIRSRSRACLDAGPDAAPRPHRITADGGDARSRAGERRGRICGHHRGNGPATLSGGGAAKCTDLLLLCPRSDSNRHWT